jgi:hypothetical protein
LNRILDCINLVKNNRPENISLQKLFTEKAVSALSWMNNMTFSNREMPHFNDSAQGIAPTPDQLVDYAKQLEVYADRRSLSESGYQKFSFTNYEFIQPRTYPRRHA